MVIQKSYKVRFYPNTEQIALLAQCFGSSRFVYNLVLWSKSRFRTGTSKTFDPVIDIEGYHDIDQSLKILTKFKNEFLRGKDENGNKIRNPDFDPDFSFLADVPETIINQSLRNLKTAFSNFFDPKLQAGYPKYKKRQMKASARFQLGKPSNTANFYQPFNLFKLPKLGACKIKWPKNLGAGAPKMATVSRSADGKYWISFGFETEIKQYPKTGNSIGIDLGLKTRAVDSNGEELAILNFTKKYEKRLARAQKVLARKKKGSNRRKRQVLRVASIHAKIANSRKNAIHKMTTKLVKENDVICTETLNAKGMMRNRKLAKSLADASFGEIIRQLEYKCDWHGRILSKIDRWFPSTKMCNGCGCLHDMPLNKRRMQCDCGVDMDRDHNAAINILAEGCRSLNVEGSTSVAGAFGHMQQVGPLKRYSSMCECDKAGAEVT